MDEICSDEREQFSLKITDFISQELKLPSENVTPDLIINKGQHMLDSEQIHMILARIADDTGVSMILLRRTFPYYRYFITLKSDVYVSFGVLCLLVVPIIFFTDRETDGLISLFLLVISFLFFIGGFLKFLDTGFIRNRKPVLTVQLFIEIIISILHKYCDECIFGVGFQERQFWRYKIYEVCNRYINIFFPAKEFSPVLIVPLSDPDEYDMGVFIEECAEVMSLSFEVIDQSGIYDKYIEYDEDELLTVVHFADLLIDFWAENKIKK